MSLPEDLARRLKLPLIAAPMLKVSGPELVIAACRAGVMGAFPTANAGSAEGVDEWLGRIQAALGPTDAPCCPNLIIHRPPEQLAADVAAVKRHQVEWVITSVGSPGPVIGPLHDAGCRVLADVGTLAHARKAVHSGADGLVLLSAGAGGQTGWLNGLAFIRAVRSFFDGPVVLAGGIADGAALWAARAAGADLAYMGTRFIATVEANAEPAYKTALTEYAAHDTVYTNLFTGVHGNYLGPSIAAAGLDPENLPVADKSKMNFGSGGNMKVKAWRDIWGSGQGIGQIKDVPPVAELVERLKREFDEARGDFVMRASA